MEGIIEVITGLIFAWLILSVATMQIQEWLSGINHTRSKALEKAIEHLLNSEILAQIFYENPLILSLSNSVNEKGKYKPSYIPANQFAATIIEMILGASRESWPTVVGLYGLRARLEAVRDRTRKRHAAAELERLIEMSRVSLQAESGKPFSNLVLTTLEKEIVELGIKHKELKSLTDDLLASAHFQHEQIEKLSKSIPIPAKAASENGLLLKGITAIGLGNPHLGQVFTGFLATSDRGGNEAASLLPTMQSKIELWFNDSMDRLSGWFKRKTQISTIVLGCLIALLLNIDTINIANQLWRDPTLRQLTISTIEADMSRLDPAAEPSDSLSRALIFEQLWSDIQIPVGWSLDSIPTAIACHFNQPAGIAWSAPCSTAQESSTMMVWALVKVFGLLISGFAASQGSAYWFDILSKFVNVRLSGRKPDDERRPSLL